MKKVTLLIALSLLLFAGCDRSRTFQKSDTIMGTTVTVTVVADTAQEGEAAIDAALEEVRRLDRMMSLYKDDSELTAVNLAAGKRPVRVSPEMVDVAELARKASDLTGGAFDATIGPLAVLWQMRLRDGTVPADDEIAGVLPRVNYRDVVVDRKKSTIFLKRSGMILDLGGVAKGYAADRAAAVLKSRGIVNGIVAVAGDIRALGRRDDGSPWRIGIQHPRDPKKTLAALELSDRSISTSGDYERFQIVEKKRYHHILDPRTGRPSEGLESVTLVGDSGAAIDPLTTALFVLGRERGMALVKKLGYEAIFVDAMGTVIATPGIVLPEM